MTVGSGDVSLIGAGDEVATSTKEVVAPSTTENWMTTTDEGAIEATEDTAATLLLATGGAAALPSSALTQPVLAVRAAGQDTCVNSIVELSDPPNQSKRQ
jgi:hypothetical protein